MKRVPVKTYLKPEGLAVLVVMAADNGMSVSELTRLLLKEVIRARREAAQRPDVASPLKVAA